MQAIKSLLAITVLATATAGAHAVTVGTFNVTVNGPVTDYTGASPVVIGASVGSGTATLDSDGTLTVNVPNLNLTANIPGIVNLNDQVPIQSVFHGTYSNSVFSINDPGDLANGVTAQGLGQETTLDCSGNFCDANLTGGAVGTAHPYAYGSVGNVSLASGGTIATLQLIADSYTYARDFTFTPSAPAVPVPATAWLFGSGLLGLAGTARRRLHNS